MLLHDQLDTRITLHNFFCLRFSRIELTRNLYGFNFVLFLFVERKMFVVDQVMDGGVIAYCRKAGLYLVDGSRCQFFIANKIAYRYLVELLSGLQHYFF